MFYILVWSFSLFEEKVHLWKVSPPPSRLKRTRIWNLGKKRHCVREFACNTESSLPRNLVPKGALVTHTRRIRTYCLVITDKIFAVWYTKRIGDLSNLKKKGRHESWWQPSGNHKLHLTIIFHSKYTKKV